MKHFRLRTATFDDADQVALLHADSWRRHYRGAYADDFLDGDVVTNRRHVWPARLASRSGTSTILAEDEQGLAGFVHVVFDDDPRWGSLIDNLHVRNSLRRTGIGTTLLAEAASAILSAAATPAVYLWVLEQNRPAQSFYRARGGAQAERLPCRPANIPVTGTPTKLRITWPNAKTLNPHPTPKPAHNPQPQTPPTTKKPPPPPPAANPTTTKTSAPPSQRKRSAPHPASEKVGRHPDSPRHAP